VLTGREHVLADEITRKALELAVPDESVRALNVDSIDAQGSSLGEIASRAAALPFLSDRRVVIVRNTIDLKKEERDLVAAGCQNVPEHALVLVTHTGRPQRPAGRRPADEAFAFARQTPGGLVIDCTLSAPECERYIDEYSAQLGVKVDAAARAALAACEDVAEIRNVLQRLALTARGKRIRFEDVREYSVSPEETKLWDIGDAVNRGDAATALRLIREALVQSDSAMGPLIWIAGDTQAIWELSRGAHPDALARAFGQNPYRFKKLSSVARKFSPQRARERANMAMLALERSITGERQGDQQLEELSVRLASNK
jgi:DNA polymerase III delta subunit